MSNYDDIDFDKPSKSSASPLQIWDLLSIGMLFMTLCIGIYFVLVFMFPNSSINPLSPSRFDALLPPTATITPLGLPPTWTPTSTPDLPATETPPPTFTPIFTPTFFSLIPPTNTPKPTATPKAPFNVTVTPIDSTIIHPELGCNWLGVRGEVVDRNNSPMLFMQVQVGGTLNGQFIDPNLHTTVTGIEYGKATFELPLGTVPIASNNTLWIHVLDQAGVPISQKVYFSTYNDCTKNMILIRFKDNRSQ
ncbi:MAG: hypothetical protein AB1564_01435 [Chloroflexota bacterium]